MEERSPPVTEAPREAPNNPPEPSATPQYEFTEKQNEVMKELDWKLGATGSVILLAAIALGITLVRVLIKGEFPYGGWAAAGAVLVIILIFAHGAWLLNAAKGFEEIYKTRGKDIDHLMEALTNLSLFFTLMAVTAVIVFLTCLVYGLISIFS